MWRQQLMVLVLVVVVVMVMLQVAKGQRQQWSSRGIDLSRVPVSSVRVRSDVSSLSSLRQRYDPQRSSIREFVDVGPRAPELYITLRQRELGRSGSYINDLGTLPSAYARSSSMSGMGSGLRDSSQYYDSGDRYTRYDIVNRRSPSLTGSQRDQGQGYYVDRSRSFEPTGLSSGSNYDMYQTGPVSTNYPNTGAGAVRGDSQSMGSQANYVPVNSLNMNTQAQQFPQQGNTFSNFGQAGGTLTTVQQSQQQVVVQPAQNTVVSGAQQQLFVQPSQNTVASGAQQQLFVQPSQNTVASGAQQQLFVQPSQNTVASGAQQQLFVQPAQNTVVSGAQQVSSPTYTSNVATGNMQLVPAANTMTTYVQPSTNVVPVVQQTGTNLVPVSTVLQPASFVLQQPALVSVATQPAQTVYQTVPQSRPTGFGGLGGMGSGLAGHHGAMGGGFPGMPPVIVKIEDMFPSFQHPMSGAAGAVGGSSAGGQTGMGMHEYNADPNLSVIKLDEGLQVVVNHSNPHKKLVNLPTPTNEEEAKVLRKILENAEAPEYIKDMIQIQPLGINHNPLAAAAGAAAAAAAAAATATSAAATGAMNVPAQVAATAPAVMATSAQTGAASAVHPAATVAQPATIVAQPATVVAQPATAVMPQTAPATVVVEATPTTGGAAGSLLQADMAIDEIIGSAYGGTGGSASYPVTSHDPNSQFVLTGLDMELTRAQYAELHASPGILAGRFRRKAVTNTRARWPGAVIPFEFKPGFSVDHQQQILAAMAEWTQSTCLHFKPALPSDSNVLVFRPGKGCSSNVGMIGGHQYLTLQKECMVRKILLHEIGHAIGLIHEHQRQDRDQYLKIHYENIKPGGIKDFDLFKRGSVDNSIAPYDYMSVMHYGKTAFARQSGLMTMQAVDPKFTDVMGTANSLSVSDITTVNVMYGCNTGGIYNTATAVETSLGQGTLEVLDSSVHTVIDTAGVASPVQGVQVAMDSCASYAFLCKLDLRTAFRLLGRNLVDRCHHICETANG